MEGVMGVKPERLLYTFVSYASHYDTPWGQGVALDGIERTAELAHKHGIPVTWIVNGRSIPVLTERIRAWHTEYGDSVILQSPFFMEDAGMSKEKFKAALERDARLLVEAFPWVTTKVAARGKIYNEVIEVLEELGFAGMWGYCWEQVWWDGITHKGIPWGSWYVDSRRYKTPHPGKGKVVACEWTARDLNLTYHSGSPCIYSTDPDDVYRAGLCTGENIEYWKQVFHQYMSNTEHNEHVTFLQQQEAHEMEYTSRFAVFTPEQVEACAVMLDRFFAYITTYPITLTTVPEAIERYHTSYEITPPTYMLTRDTQGRPEVNDYTMALGGAGIGPWPDTFFYYDHECQLAFVDGYNVPHRLQSYVGKGEMHDDFVESCPQVFVASFERTEERIRLAYDIGHWRPMPFGLAYWDDLAEYEVESCTVASHVKQIGDRLVFMKLQLTGEPLHIELTLRRKGGEA